MLLLTETIKGANSFLLELVPVRKKVNISILDSFPLNDYRINPKYWNTLFTYHTFPKIWNSPFYYLFIVWNIAVCIENSVDPDQTPRSAASDLGLYCLQRYICPNMVIMVDIPFKPKSSSLPASMHGLTITLAYGFSLIRYSGTRSAIKVAPYDRWLCP